MGTETIEKPALAWNYDSVDAIAMCAMYECASFIEMAAWIRVDIRALNRGHDADRSCPEDLMELFFEKLPPVQKKTTFTINGGFAVGSEVIFTIEAGQVYSG